MKRNNIKNKEIKPIEISHFNRMQNFNFKKRIERNIFFSLFSIFSIL